MKSIIQNDKKCYVCGSQYALEKHHCIHGTAGRRLADRYGLTVWLCPACHRGAGGVHGRDGAGLDKILKQDAQTAYEGVYGRQKWLETFGKNYKED